MRVIVLNTGTELLLGSVLNTHLTFIAREIFPLGLRVERQLTVPDGLAIRESLAKLLGEAEIIFVTGGLGPTSDDVTREAAAELLGLELRQHPEIAELITMRLATRGFPMTDRILRQADVPDGAVVLPNAHGTAPGLYLRAMMNTLQSPVHLFLLPGPPRELEPMFRTSVMPILRDLLPAESLLECRNFRIAGVGESVVEAAIGAQLTAIPDLELGYCARPGEVDVRLLGRASALEEAERMVRAAFGNSIFTTGEENLEDVIVRLLAERNQTVAMAESCTGGYLAHRITNVPGASGVFRAGYFTYANEAKIDSLGVEAAAIAEDGVVSARVCRQMAEGALRHAHTTHALATTGIAGPSGGSEQKPVGTVYIALASRGTETQVVRRRFLSDRESFKRLVSQTALEMLRQRLLQNVPTA